MKTFRKLVFGLVVLFGLSAVMPAEAHDRRYRHRHVYRSYDRHRPAVVYRTVRPRYYRSYRTYRTHRPYYYRSYRPIVYRSYHRPYYRDYGYYNYPRYGYYSRPGISIAFGGSWGHRHHHHRHWGW